MRLNGIALVEGTSIKPAILAPRQESDVPIKARLKSENLDDWWVAHLKNGEFTRVDVEIDAVLNIENAKFPIRVLKCSSTLKTDILNPEGKTESSKPKCLPAGVLTR